MKAVCPNCGVEVELKRRPLGSGTEIDPATPLSFTESQVYQQMDGAYLDVRGVQGRLIGANIKKNYHQVQAALSTLVWRKMVVMDISRWPPRYARLS